MCVPGSVVRVLIDVAFALLYFTSLGKGGWLTSSDPRVDPTQDTIKVCSFLLVVGINFCVSHRRDEPTFLCRTEGIDLLPFWQHGH